MLLSCPALALRSASQLQAAWGALVAVAGEATTERPPQPMSPEAQALEVVSRLPSVLASPLGRLPGSDLQASPQQALQWLTAQPQLLSRSPQQVQQATSVLAQLGAPPRSSSGGGDRNAWLCEFVTSTPLALCVPAQALRDAAAVCQASIWEHPHQRVAAVAKAAMRGQPAAASPGRDRHGVRRMGPGRLRLSRPLWLSSRREVAPALWLQKYPRASRLLHTMLPSLT